MFIIAKKWKQFKCPPIDDWINITYPYNRILFDILLHVTTSTLKYEKPKTVGNSCHGLFHVSVSLTFLELIHFLGKVPVLLERVFPGPHPKIYKFNHSSYVSIPGSSTVLLSSDRIYYFLTNPLSKN